MKYHCRVGNALPKCVKKGRGKLWQKRNFNRRARKSGRTWRAGRHSCLLDCNEAKSARCPTGKLRINLGTNIDEYRAKPWCM